MTELILLQRLYGARFERCRLALQQTLDSIANELEVKIKIKGHVGRAWVCIDVQGEDETVVINQLYQRFGFAPKSMETLKLPCTLSGYAVDIGKVGYGAYVDIGLPSQEMVDVLIPLHILRSQLADGEKVSLRRILEAYNLVDNLPLSLRLTRVDIEAKKLEAELSDYQISVFERWVHDGLERILALGVPMEDCNEALRMASLERDVVGIESLGLFEHTFTCKLGTQAPGIIGRLGKYLQGIPLYAFLPDNTWLRQR